MRITVTSNKDIKSSVPSWTISELLANKAEGIYRPINVKSEEKTFLIMGHIGCMGTVPCYFVYNGMAIFRPVDSYNGYWNYRWIKSDEKITMEFQP